MGTIGGGALLQAITLVIFARALGPAEYATIVLAGASAMVAAEFVGFGSGDLHIREVSRDPAAHPSAFGRALRLSAATVVPLSLIAAILVWLTLAPGSSFTVLLSLIASEIVLIRTSILADQIAIAHHATHTANATRLFAMFVRFAAVCAAVYLAEVSSAAEWSVFAAGSAIIAGVACLTISGIRFGRPVFTRGAKRTARMGLLFSSMQILRAVQFSLDKFAVASVAPAAAVGAFGVSSRSSQLGIMPGSAITRITYPIFFEKGAQGIDVAISFAFRIAPAVLGVAALSSVGLVAVAYALPLLLGSEFALAKDYLFILAPLPVASALQNLTGDVLTGSDHQGQRIVAAITGVLLTFFVTAVGALFAGVVGAIAGYLIGHFLFAITTGLAIVNVRQRNA